MKTKLSEEIVGIKELRENMDRYIDKVHKGSSFTIVRRSKPVFKITPLDAESEQWETVVDFTEMKKGGASLSDVRKAIACL